MRSCVIALVLLAAGCPNNPQCKNDWKPVGPLDRPLLSAWEVPGTGEVYTVGGGLGATGLGALALHWNGSSWQSLPVNRPESLWWVWGTDDGKDVWMVGEQGLILRWDGTTVTTVTSGTTATLYGVWGTSSSDVWIVGGTPNRGTAAPNDIVLHWDGQALSTTDSPMPKGATFFKVWGAGTTDLWVSGEGGTMWHRTATGWADESSQLATRASVTTVHGCSSTDVWAVAGQEIFHFDGTSWSPAPGVQALSGTNGVSCSPATVLVVGNGGLKLIFDRATHTWTDDTLVEPYDADFHGALVEKSGDLWAVGGNFNAPASSGRSGSIAFFGCPVPLSPQH
jgi:hypothetical protein